MRELDSSDRRIAHQKSDEGGALCVYLGSWVFVGTPNNILVHPVIKRACFQLSSEGHGLYSLYNTIFVSGT